MTPLFAFNLGPMEIALLLVLGVLLFGRRLPEVGRYLGKGIVEFKKGVKGLEDEVDSVNPMSSSNAAITSRSEQPQEQIRPPQRVGTTAPKFEDSTPPVSATNSQPQA